MRIVHIQTTVQTTFGVLDDDGNAVPAQPVSFNVARLSPQAFAEVHDAIVHARDEAIAAEEQQPGVVEHTPRGV